MLLIDSANIPAIVALRSTGLFVGVTTNPSVLAKEGMGIADCAKLHADLAGHSLKFEFYQTVGDSYESMVESGRDLHCLNGSSNIHEALVVVKVPATSNGYRAAVKLHELGAQVLLTAVYHPTQALAAKELGCWGIAPYAGRIEDCGKDPIREIGKMVNILMGSEQNVLAASLRNPEIIGDLAAVGVQCFTAPPAVWKNVIDNQNTIKALEQFINDEI